MRGLCRIAHGIIEREAIMAGDEIHAVDRLLAAALVKIGAAAEPRGERARHPGVATPEATYVVAEAAVPFGPALSWKAAPW